VVIEDEVFVGPGAIFTNDKHPKAVGDWEITPTLVKRGASIGAGAVIVCGVIIGEGAVVGAGAVVTKDVPAGMTVVGNPAVRISHSAPEWPQG
jgi:acetyltransferase-like isoleucine patch superfamily enzyme